MVREDERARCIKVLEDLRDRGGWIPASLLGINAALNALDGRYDACARCDHTREFHDFGGDIPSPWCFVDDCDCEVWLDAPKPNDAPLPVASSPVGGEQR
jgi:hypothetical protein